MTSSPDGAMPSYRMIIKRAKARNKVTGSKKAKV
jgi:hypothetical protein